MRLHHVVAYVLLSAPLLQDSGSLVQAFGVDDTKNVCVASEQEEANPVDVSIGDEVSCGLLPNNKAICWKTDQSPTTGTVLSGWGTGVDSIIHQVFVSDNSQGAGSKICAWVYDDADDALGDVKCTSGDPITDDSVVTWGAWTTFYENANYAGVTSKYICAARSISPSGVSHRCRLINDGAATVVLGPTVESGISDISLRTYSQPSMKAFYSGPSSDHICKLLADDSLNCVGDNTKGAVNPSHARNAQFDWQSSVAVDIVVPQIKSVALGTYHTCAIKKDNTIWCWGDGFTDTSNDLVQIHEGDGVPRAITAGDGFTCYVTNNKLKCFVNGENAVPVKFTLSTVATISTLSSPIKSVFTVWAGKTQACVQVTVNGLVPAPGVTRCFTGVDGAVNGADQHYVASQPSMFALPLGCAFNANCVTTEDDMNFNYGLELNQIPLEFGPDAIVEGADDDSYFGLSATFHPEQFLPPGVHSAMFAYIIPTDQYTNGNKAAGNGCVLTPADAPFSTRIKKKCFQLTTPINAASDVYSAKVVLRTCLMKSCGTYSEAGDIFGDSSSNPYFVIGATASTVFGNSEALNGLTMCPYLSVLDFTVTVEIGNLVETTQRIDLNWARDDVTEADGDSAASAVAINDDLSQPVEWAICDRAVDITVAGLDAGYDYQSCFVQVNEDGNNRVVQLSRSDTSDFNMLAMGFRMHKDDRRLVNDGFLTLIPGKTSLNLFHSEYNGLKTGSACATASAEATMIIDNNGGDKTVAALNSKCTHVKFDGTLTYSLNTKDDDPSSYQYTGDLNYLPDDAVEAQDGMQKYEVSFNGQLPRFYPGMGCGTGGKFCTIVMELTFEMGTPSGSTTTRRLVQRQVHLPMRMLGDEEGTDITVALAQAGNDDPAALSGEVTTDLDFASVVGPSVGGLVFVSVGVAFLMRRRGKEEEEVPAKKYDMEKGSNVVMS